MLCKLLGIVDITAGILLISAFGTWWAWILAIVMFIKGVPSLFG